MTPSETALTRSLRDAYSGASERVTATSPHFGEGRQRGGSGAVGMVHETRGDVHDVTATAADHLRDCPLGDVEEPGQVHRGDREVVIKCVIGEGLANVDSCVVDQGVDPTEPIERVVDHSLGSFGLGDVTPDGEIVLLVGGRGAAVIRRGTSRRSRGRNGGRRR